MYIYWLVLVMLLGASALFSQAQYNEQSVSEQATLDAISRSMLVYRSAAAEYAWANPGFVGVPPETALSLPDWYSKQSGITAYVASGVSYTYITGPIPAGLPAALTARTESTTVGVKRSGHLYSPKGGDMAIPIPAPVPEGAVIAVY
ncbi:MULTISPECIES: type IV pilus biogenesis protein PilM [Pseudomonas]|uniref:PilM protein n=1 Tax=Pseudomonas entomophila TaxID=312306 RepID=A0A3S8UPC6_9PSED|nr:MULTISPECIES: type IV pilus biogenesis protein PilM [Pseudomonas]AZL70093.1 pilM protein [Pseudomonas oryziphila]MDZ4020662.1 hypothetical protein [Pseudomonas sichuanensis]